MSDAHDNWSNLQKAIKIANNSECKILLFVGDLIAPPGIEVLEKFKGKVKFVWGNNEGEKTGVTRKMDSSNKTELCGDIYEGKLGNVRIFMNHYPKISELAAQSGKFDLSICGHFHKYWERKVDNCLFINPGEIQGLKGKPTFIIFNTSDKKVKKIVLD